MSEVTVTMSATIGKLAAALAKAQAEMKPAVKDEENPHFKSRFASLASCVEALKPLHANGIAVVQPPAPHGTEGVSVTTLLLHESGEWLRGDLYMPASKKDPQGFGSALSYARRYCLCAVTMLATDDDDGESASKLATQAKPPAKTSAPSGVVSKALTDRLNGAATVDDLKTIVADVHKAAKAKQITATEFAELGTLHLKRKAELAPTPDPAALLKHFENRFRAAKSMAELKGIGAEVARSALDDQQREFLDGVYVSVVEGLDAA